jgi:hypothetical protein
MGQCGGLLRFPVKLFSAGGVSSMEKGFAMIRRDYLQEIGLDPV